MRERNTYIKSIYIYRGIEREIENILKSNDVMDPNEVTDSTESRLICFLIEGEEEALLGPMCIYIYMCVCMYICVLVCMYVYESIYMYVCMFYMFF